MRQLFMQCSSLPIPSLFGDLTEREDFAALLREKIADVYALIN